MRVIGVDPGTQKTGIGIVDKNNQKLSAVFYETIQINPKLTRPQKLDHIYQGVSQVIQEFQPELMVIEDVFYFRNFKAALRIGEARAMAMLAACKNNLDVFEYLPTKIKGSVCGNGRGSKQQMQFMVRTILELREQPEEDAADALAAAICHFNQVLVS